MVALGTYIVALGGVHGCSRGRGMHGCSGGCVVALGVCVVALRGHAWLLWGACVVAPRGACVGYDQIWRYDQ